MSTSFFIETSIGLINRNKIAFVTPCDLSPQDGIMIRFDSGERVFLFDEEAAMLLTVCSPGITIGKNEAIEQIKKFADTENAPTNNNNLPLMEVEE